MWLILLTLYINCVLRLYLFIWLCYRKLVCVAHFDVWTLALSRIISMMTTDLLLLLFERNRRNASLIQIKRGNLLKSNQNISLKPKRPRQARVCVFVLRCSASVYSCVSFLDALFSFKTSPVFIWVISSTPVCSLIKIKKKDKNTTACKKCTVICMFRN